MTIEDYFNGASFEDEIGRYNYPVDLHSAKIGEIAKHPGIYDKGYPVGKSYGISYRALVPIGTKNLLLAGRCIGADREMMGSLRVMPCCFITGMAAGTAAALCIQTDSTPKTLDTALLRKHLKKAGAYLP